MSRPGKIGAKPAATEGDLPYFTVLPLPTTTPTHRLATTGPSRLSSIRPLLRLLVCHTALRRKRTGAVWMDDLNSFILASIVDRSWIGGWLQGKPRSNNVHRNAAPPLPQPARDRQRIELDALPPGRLITMSMQLPVMGSTQRNSKLIADLSTQGAGLSKAQMVGVGRRPTTDHAGLPGHELAMVLVAQPDGLGWHPAARRGGLVCNRRLVGGLQN